MLEEIDGVCDAFEAEWRHGGRPRIEVYLAGWGEPRRSELFRELLETELVYRRRAAESVTGADYARRFPEYAGLIAEVLRGGTRSEPQPSEPASGPAVSSTAQEELAVSQATDRSDCLDTPRVGALRVRCPHCHQGLELSADAPLKDVDCPLCGSGFSLVQDVSELAGPQKGVRVAQFELI